MNYQTYVGEFFSYIYNNFSGLEDLVEIKQRYEELIEKYPNFYTICDNNLNFLFIENFVYTPQFLHFLSDKIDLNFIGGENLHSPLTYHFCKKNNNGAFLITSDTNSLEFLKNFEENFYNYLSFRQFDLEKTYIKDSYGNRSSINADVLSALRHRFYSNADWQRTIDIVLKQIFKFHVQPEEFYINDPVSLSSQFVLLINSLPNNKIEEKTMLFNYLDKCLANKIDWKYKNSKDTYFAYEFIESLVKNIPNSNEHSIHNYKQWKEFTDFIIYDKILASGFSFNSEYKKKESLYYYIENFWLKTILFEEQNEFSKLFYEELLVKAKTVEERHNMANKISDTQKHSIKTLRKI